MTSASATQVTTDRAAGIAYWRRPGTGRSLVCLHGIGSNADSFRSLLDHLPVDWDVIAWTAPGYRDSDPLAPDWPVEADYAAALDAFLDGLSLRRVTLLGHSLGTLIAARFAASHADRVEALVLSAAACGHGKTAGTELSRATAERLEELQAMGPRAFAEKRAPRLLARPDARPEARTRVVDAMAEIRMPGYGQAVRMLASGNLEASLDRVLVPAHILWGTGDVITPRIQSEKAAWALGGIAITEIDDAGHASHVETPEAFSRALLAALDAAPARTETETAQ